MEELRDHLIKEAMKSGTSPGDKAALAREALTIDQTLEYRSDGAGETALADEIAELKADLTNRVGQLEADVASLSSLIVKKGKAKKHG